MSDEDKAAADPDGDRITELLLIAKSTQGDVVLARKEVRLTRNEVARHGKTIATMLGRLDTVETQIMAGVLDAPPDGLEPPEPFESERHDTESPAHLPPMRVPAQSITNEVEQSTTRASLRVMATSAATTAAETKAQTPIITANAAETAKQTPLLAEALKRTTTTTWIGVANFLSVLIAGVIIALTKACQVPPQVIYSVPSIAAPAPAPAVAPAPARPPTR